MLVNRVQKNDIVVTQDDPDLPRWYLRKMATQLIKMGDYIQTTILIRLLYARHNAQKIRMGGGRLWGA